ncbi:MAG: SPOR domain-containing protein [Bacteroidia bacterium]|nr:SPOR domain-containing protein [Bacteroidia bacterium]
MKTILVVMLSLWAINKSYAQQYVQVLGDANLDSLVLQNIEHNKIAEGIQGYRIQIFFGSDRKAANDARTKFLQLFPEVEAYLVYQQPNFKVRVGDFRNQLEAQPVYRSILTQFETVFIVPDKIALPRLSE